MTETIKPTWLAMSPARLWQHLHDKKYPTAMVMDIVAQAQRVKSERRKARIKQTVAQQLWHELLDAARIELGIVRTLKSQTKRRVIEEFGHASTQAKYDALCAYDAVITSVIERLRRAQRTGEATPSQFAKFLNDNGKGPIPNNGEHWSDFVKIKDRRDVERMFDNLPDPARGKRKTPFERRISPDEHVLKRAHLVGQLAKAKEDL